jgi:hypothetical protein
LAATMNQKSSLREKPQSVPRVLTPDNPRLELTGSRLFTAWLAGARASLASGVTTSWRSSCAGLGLARDAERAYELVPGLILANWVEKRR